MNRNLLKSDRVSGLIWLVLGIGLCIGSIKLNLGSLHNPGPGFMPFLSGALLGLFGLILMFSDISRSLREKGEVKVKEVLVKENWRKILFTFSTLVGYIILFEPLGFFITTFLFFFFLFKLTETKKWLMPLIFSGGAVILSYLIFSVWLKCSLPRGILKF